MSLTRDATGRFDPPVVSFAVDVGDTPIASFLMDTRGGDPDAMADATEDGVVADATADGTAYATDETAGGESPVYYGNAEPEGRVVILGGAAVAASGWAAYEASRRAARWQAAPARPDRAPHTHYPGRRVITGGDAAESLALAGGAADPLARAAARLAAAIPAGAPVSPDDVEAAAAETDPDELWRTAAAVAAYTGVDAPPMAPPLPPAPTRAVAVAPEQDRAIALLEAAAVPRAAAIEDYRARVAAVFAEAEKALSGNSFETRGAPT